uniref:Type VI secretion system protein ImpF n=1 Tax=Candidatus Kentrum sp. DK TaxID=2126562 RepID=A0A450SP09_9GAMM|nr:MAG: type VI secretion system protein ImpF [Candidatus Kentron sp. DK]VFJ62735.1 MAG: type VI secretion system protein ImpF [Candidatus Kentron sp. DK]
MPELIHQEKRQPSLLDRLMDDEPWEKKDPPEKRLLSPRQLKESVVWNLGWLMNTTHLASSVPLEEYEEVRHSCLNFGLPELRRHTLSGLDAVELERGIRRAIIDFEPRILKNTLRVTVNMDPEAVGRERSMLTFHIQGEIWTQPAPVPVYLRSVVDVEIGDVTISDIS